MRTCCHSLEVFVLASTKSAKSMMIDPGLLLIGDWDWDWAVAWAVAWAVVWRVVK